MEEPSGRKASHQTYRCYHVAFYVLGSFAVVSVGMWVGFAGTLRPACAGSAHTGKPRALV